MANLRVASVCLTVYSEMRFQCTSFLRMGERQKERKAEREKAAHSPLLPFSPSPLLEAPTGSNSWNKHQKDQESSPACSRPASSTSAITSAPSSSTSNYK